jgi:hypothetical protein
VTEARVRAAAVENALLARAPRPNRRSQAEYRSAAAILAATQRGDHGAGAAGPTGQPGWPTVPPPARPQTAAPRGASPEVWPSARRDAIEPAPSFGVAFEPDRPEFGGGAALRGDDRDPLPLLVVPETLHRQALGAPGQPEMTILAAPGQGIAAPVDGRIVFADQFKSYGLLLIIEHEHEYHTLLWGFARLDVSLGERVRVGQIVGIMGTSSNDPPVLHVERRRNGRPVNLAAGSSGIQG